MGRITLKTYVRNSIRFRILWCLLLSLLFGLLLAWASAKALSGLKVALFQPAAYVALIFFFMLLYTTLILMSLVSVMLRPLMYLNRRLRQLKSRADIRRIDPAEFVELAPLIETTLDYLDWAENQQNLSAAIHHAFRKRIEHLAEYDSLTGLYNRHYLQTILPLQIAHMANIKDRLSLIMLDVDHFKHYNDTNGHPEGDQVLALIAQILQNSVREQDICCRYGGEEFLIVLPSASGEKALAIAKRIRHAIEHTPFRFEERQPMGRVTASLGIASFPEHAATPNELIECADQAMYLAKRQGRNRTCTYGEIHEPGPSEVETVEPVS